MIMCSFDEIVLLFWEIIGGRGWIRLAKPNIKILGILEENKPCINWSCHMGLKIKQAIV